LIDATFRARLERDIAGALGDTIVYSSTRSLTPSDPWIRDPIPRNWSTTSRDRSRWIAHRDVRYDPTEAPEIA
jgi:hypothetical protein